MKKRRLRFFDDRREERQLDRRRRCRTPPVAARAQRVESSAALAAMSTSIMRSTPCPSGRLRTLRGDVLLAVVDHLSAPAVARQHGLLGAAGRGDDLRAPAARRTAPRSGRPRRRRRPPARACRPLRRPSAPRAARSAPGCRGRHRPRRPRCRAAPRPAPVAARCTARRAEGPPPGGVPHPHPLAEACGATPSPTASTTPVPSLCGTMRGNGSTFGAARRGTSRPTG